MRVLLLAMKPTDSVTEGFLPAAERLGLDVTVLTDRPAAHSGAGVEVVEAPVRDPLAMLDAAARLGPVDGVFSNSDHLQAQAALLAAYLGLPGKDWRAAATAKNKRLTRRAVEHLDPVYARTLRPEDPVRLHPPYPCVLKPVDGVASEDVFLCADGAELVARIAEVRGRRPGATLLVEQFLAGPLHTLETLGDTSERRALGGFRTELSDPPYFIETRMTWRPELPAAVRADLDRQLDAVGVGLGACHTEFVVQGDRARLIEVNYRAVGDQGDLLLAGLLDLPYFELVLRAHLGDPVTRELPDTPDPARCARIDYAIAQEPMLLTAAPPASDTEVEGIHLSYRPLRTPGLVELTHTNRDYLGVLRAYGRDEAAMERAIDGFWAGTHEQWELGP